MAKTQQQMTQTEENLDQQSRRTIVEEKERAIDTPSICCSSVEASETVSQSQQNGDLVNKKNQRYI